MKLIPLFDRVVVKLVKEEESNKNGIFLPVAAKEKQEIAQVIAVGKGGLIDGNQVEMIVSVGDKVVYSKYAGSEFTIDGEVVTIIRQSDILAKVE